MPCAPLKLILTSPGCLIKTLYLQISINATGAQRNVCALKSDFFKTLGGRSFWKSATAWNFYMRFSFDGIILIKQRALENLRWRRTRIEKCQLEWLDVKNLLTSSPCCGPRVCVFYLFMYMEFLICAEARIPCLRSLYNLGWWTFLFSRSTKLIVSGFQIIISRKHWHKYYELHRFYGRLLILFFASLTRTHYYADQNLIWREAPRWFYSLSISKAHYQSAWKIESFWNNQLNWQHCKDINLLQDMPRQITTSLLRFWRTQL